MLSPDSRRFVGPFLLWLVPAVVAFLLFLIWAKQKTLAHRDIAALVGGVACLISMTALTEIIRRAISPASSLVSVGIHVVGVGVALVIAFTYTLVFTFLWAKDF